MEICKQQNEIYMLHLTAISIYCYVGGFIGVRVGIFYPEARILEVSVPGSLPPTAFNYG